MSIQEQLMEMQDNYTKQMKKTNKTISKLNNSKKEVEQYKTQLDKTEKHLTDLFTTILERRYILERDLDNDLITDSLTKMRYVAKIEVLNSLIHEITPIRKLWGVN